MGDCQHKHGDYVPELMGWVCGQCYQILPQRPHQAETRLSKEGTRLRVFLKFLADRFQSEGRLEGQDAWDAALEVMGRIQDEEFADPTFDWSRVGAAEIADEDMSYWDIDEMTGENSF